MGRNVLFFYSIAIFVLFHRAVLNSPEILNIRLYMHPDVMITLHAKINNFQRNIIEKTFRPPSSSEIEASSIIEEYVPPHEKLLQEQDEEQIPLHTPPSSLLPKVLFYIKQWLGISDSKYILGTEPYYSNSSMYSQVDLEDFDILNETVLQKYSKESPVFIHIPMESDSNVCSLDVSNVLPGELSPRKQFSSFNHESISDEDFRKRNAEVDAALREREKWMYNSKEFSDMRGQVILDEEAVYASDHFDYRYTKDMYVNIRELEKRVIYRLHQRIEQDDCFRSSVEKYKRMSEEIASSYTEKLERLRNETNRANFKRSRKYYKPISDKDLLDLYRQNKKELSKQRRKDYANVFIRTQWKRVCDGCPFPNSGNSEGKSKIGGVHMIIRKWIGNKEQRQIYTNENRRIM